MHSINHPNIMHLYEYMESSNNYYLVISYCKDGDLEKYLSKKPKNLLTEKEALFFLKQIMNGFKVLHEHKVMHRDFKLANIFLHENNIVIGDFGFAKAGYDMAQTKLGTPITMAPEIHNGEVTFCSQEIHLQSRLVVHRNGVLPPPLRRVPLLRPERSRTDGQHQKQLRYPPVTQVATWSSMTTETKSPMMSKTC